MHEKLIIKESNYCNNFEVKIHGIICGSMCGICMLLFVCSILNWVLITYVNLTIVINSKSCIGDNGLVSVGCALFTAELWFLFELIISIIIAYIFIIILRFIYRCITYNKTLHVVIEKESDEKNQLEETV